MEYVMLFISNHKWTNLGHSTNLIPFEPQKKILILSQKTQTSQPILKKWIKSTEISYAIYKN